MRKGRGFAGRLVRRTGGPLLVIAAALAAAPAAVPAAQQRPCGLPDTSPLWIDYSDGSVPFRDQVFGKPGIIVAASGPTVPAALRREGAQTVHFELKLPSYIGTTAKPVDPDSIDGAAQKIFDRAAASTGCGSPVILLNELQGAGLITPWSATNAVYRADVLALLQGLQKRGALPILLINSLPYTGAPEAVDWWRQAAQAGWVGIETYFNGPQVYRQGPIAANRALRTQFRRAVQSLTSIGVPAGRVGFMLGFQSQPGAGGREGLQPASAWFELVKWETLAAAEVAAETGVSTVMTWGWATFSTAPGDEDKPAAACVYLWTRDQSLCDGPTAAGPGFNPSLTDGQLVFQPGVQCVVGGTPITTGAIDQLALLTRDRDAAFTALFQRVVDNGASAPIAADRILGLERAVILNHFGGSRSAYLAALDRQHTTLDEARAILGDELRRSDIAAGLAVARPTDRQVADYYATYANLPVRTVSAEPAASWLAGGSRGLAIASFAPPQVFTIPVGRQATLEALDGRYSVRPLDNPTPLGAIPLARIGPTIRAALAGFARNDAYTRWSADRQQRALDRALCVGDRLPIATGVDLTAYLPFLATQD